MQTIKITTIPVEEAKQFWIDEFNKAKVEFFNEVISVVAKINWDEYGNLMSQREVADVFGRDASTVRTWIDADKLKVTKDGDRIVGVHKDSVMRFYFNKR